MSVLPSLAETAIPSPCGATTLLKLRGNTTAAGAPISVGFRELDTLINLKVDNTTSKLLAQHGFCSPREWEGCYMVVRGGAH